jgi:hypothetical protein
MAVWTTKLFRSRDTMLDYLNGVIIGGVNVHAGAAVDGLTLIIDAGSGAKTVTFAPAKSRLWTLAEVVAAISAADASLVGVGIIKDINTGGVTSKAPDRRLAIFKDAAVVLDKDGTANSVFGFNTVADTSRAAVIKTNVFLMERSPREQDTWLLVINA